MDLIPIECGNCKAKLKIKANPLRMTAEVKCPKCGKPIPVGKKPAPAATVPSAAPAPAPAPAAPVSPPAPAPASSTAQLTPPPSPVAPPAAPATAPKAAAPIVLGAVTEPSAGGMINAQCPACQWQTKVAANLVGKKIRCKQCSGIILISTPGPAPAAMPAAEPATTAVAPAISEPTPAPEPPADTAPAPPPPAPMSAPHPPEPVPPAATQRIITPAPVPAPDRSVEASREIEALKVSFNATRQEAEQHRQALAAARTRAEAAEHALHELAGKHAVENITSSRRISDLETQVAALRETIAGLTADLKAELDATEKRAATLRARITAIGV